MLQADIAGLIKLHWDATDHNGDHYGEQEEPAEQAEQEVQTDEPETIEDINININI